MIRFRCNNCGKAMKAEDSQAGRKGRCPRCKRPVVVPPVPEGELRVEPPLPSRLDSSAFEKPPDSDSAQDGVGDKQAQIMNLLGQSSIMAEPEPPPERKHPWLLDIFLYPMSLPGLIMLGMITIGPPVVTWFGEGWVRFCLFLLGPLSRTVYWIGPLLAMVISGILYLYFYWYLAECIRDSALGGIRAPETLQVGGDLWEMFCQTMRLAGGYIVSFGPASGYIGYTIYAQLEPNRLLLWGLLGFGALFFPMSLLTVTMFRTIEALNPILIIRSIARTFLPYFGLALLFYGLGALLNWGIRVVQGEGFRLGGFIGWFVTAGLARVCLFWLMLVIAQLLGRFYFRYKEKLDWEV